MISLGPRVLAHFAKCCLARCWSNLLSGVLLILAVIGSAVPGRAICTDFTVSQTSLSFGTVVPGQMVSMTVLITPNDLADFTFTIQNQVPAPAFTVSPQFQRVQTPFTVRVTFQPNSSTSQGWSGELLIQGCGKSEIIDLGGGNFGGSASVDVTDLAFGTVAAGQSKALPFTVSASTDPAAPLKITVSATSPLISVNPKTFQVDQNSPRQVTVTYTPNGGVSLGSQRVLVKAVFAATNFPIAPDLTVDLTGLGFGISTFRLPNGAVGSAYSAPIEAMGGTKPYSWAVTTGALPEGLTLNMNSGVVSGNPAKDGESAFGVQATDAQNVSHKKDLSIRVGSGSARPVITSGSFLDAAGFQQPPAVGGLGSIFGEFGVATTSATQIPLPTQITGVRLLLGPPGAAALQSGGNANGALMPAPLLFVSAQQINFQVPWELASSAPGPLQAVVEVNGSASDPVQVSATKATPGIFGFGFERPAKGVVLNLSDFSAAQPAGSIPGVLSKPAQRGGVVIIYANGLGAVNPPIASGAVPAVGSLHSTVEKPIVRVGGLPADVSFAGLSPNFVGVYQVNATLAPSTPVGVAVPITIESGGQRSPEDITIAVAGAAAVSEEPN